MGLEKSGFIFLLLLSFTLPVHAEIYQPGRGILLPKRAGQTPTIRTVNPGNSNSAPTVVERGKVSQGPGAAVAVNPQQERNGSADKMTQAYAAHLYTSVCSQEYREQLAPKTEQGLDMRKLWSDVQASCKCIASEILAVIPAPELADYVMYNYASGQTQNPDNEKVTYLKSGQGNKIESLVLNEQIHSKCSFLK